MYVLCAASEEQKYDSPGQLQSEVTPAASLPTAETPALAAPAADAPRFSQPTASGKPAFNSADAAQVSGCLQSLPLCLLFYAGLFFLNFLIFLFYFILLLLFF